MAKKQTETVLEISSTDLPTKALINVASEFVKNESQQQESITDAVCLGQSIYFIKNNSTLFEKRKDGQLIELFVFPPTESRISIEGFYLNSLTFLIAGKLYILNSRNNLEVIAE